MDKSFNFLIINDSKSIQEIFKFYLKKTITKENYSIFIANNSIEAIDFLTLENIDIIIMSSRLDGLELLTKIKSKVYFNKIKIIFYSDNLIDNNELLNLGVTIIQNPLSQKTFNLALENIF